VRGVVIGDALQAQAAAQQRKAHEPGAPDEQRAAAEAEANDNQQKTPQARRAGRYGQRQRAAASQPRQPSRASGQLEGVKRGRPSSTPHSATSAAHSRIPAKKAWLAILTSVGEIDPQGTRRDGLDAFLDQKVQEGYAIETRTDTHAIVSRRPKGLKRFISGADPGRYVVEVDEDGVATMRPAEPRRA
jgi:hypothetical protein